MIRSRTFGIVLAGALAVYAGASVLKRDSGKASTENGFQIAVDKTGNIRVPDIDYRKNWVALGSWAVAAEEGTAGSEGIHQVYTQLESVEAYRKSGKFPDGAVLIKELYSTKTEDMTTGTVSRVDKITGWFVMVKDTGNKFPYRKLWGDGWGWAYFDADNPTKTTSSDYKTDCKGCHVPAQNTDWIYVDAYPVLKKK